MAPSTSLCRSLVVINIHIVVIYLKVKAWHMSDMGLWYIVFESAVLNLVCSLAECTVWILEIWQERLVVDKNTQ